MPAKKKIGFLFLDEIHHLHHFISVAIALSKTSQVSILTFPSKHDFLFSTLERLGGEKVKVEQLPTKAFRAFTDKLKSRKLPRKLFWMKKNRDYLLNNFDALVFTDYYHHYLLKKRGERAAPKFIKTQHGPAGRAYSYKKDLLDFDMRLLYGNFQKRSLEKMGLLGEHYAIGGYFKLDAVDPTPNKPDFKNEKKIVLYNPHFSPPLSSWHHIGLQVLDFFYEQEDYNLIFAPHVNLFKKKGGQDPSIIPEKYRKAKHIYIDLGSNDSVNMTYVRNSNIYLGDVSSQVYEFIISPRPCIFLNPTNASYKDDINFRFWQCGEVIKGPDDLKSALDKSIEQFTTYNEKQQKITSENFRSEEGSTASERGARAILSFLNKEKNSAQ